MFLFLFLFGAFMVLPLAYIVITAFKPLNELFIFPPRFYVVNPTVDNFTTMMRVISSSRVPFSRYLFNSVVIAVGGTILGIVVGALAAYPLAKHKFVGKAVMYNVVVWAMMFRGEVLGIPQYLIIANLGMINTYWSLLLPALAGTMSVFLMRQFMESNIPDAVIEAARIDGATRFYILRKVILPLAKPIVIYTILTAFMGPWGDFSFARYISMNNVDGMNAAVGLFSWLNIDQINNNYTMFCAGGVLVALPVTLLFMFLQKYYVEGVTGGAVKG